MLQVDAQQFLVWCVLGLLELFVRRLARRLLAGEVENQIVDRRTMRRNYILRELLHRASTNSSCEPFGDVLAITHQGVLFNRSVSKQGLVVPGHDARGTFREISATETFSTCLSWLIVALDVLIKFSWFYRFELEAYLSVVPLDEWKIRKNGVIRRAWDWNLEFLAFIVDKIDKGSERQRYIELKRGFNFHLWLCDTQVLSIWELDLEGQFADLACDFAVKLLVFVAVMADPESRSSLDV